MNPLAITIRTKKLGVLIRDARLSANKSVEECAQAIEISAADFEAYELGEIAPSLPQVELLSYYLDIPMDEGVKNSRWVLMDYGDIIIHIFEQETREFYELEKLWIGAPRIPLEE